MKSRTLFNVAEYIRLSREDGDKAESDSVGNQRKLIADYLKGKDDFVLYDTYVDDGFTGTNFKRPAFMRMIEDIEAGNVNCVIVKDLSRFGRDYIDTGKYLERYFPDRDVRFISITDNIDSMKQTYDMLLPIKNIFNEQYARDISKKVHSAMKAKQKAGEFIGAFASYGYKKSSADKNKLVIDEYAAGVVRRIFRMYISGCGKNSIAVTLNKEGIVCPSEYKKLSGENYRNSHKLESTSYWTYSTINRLLQNEMYVGNMVQGRKTQRMRGKQHATERQDWIIVKGTHEAIIDKDTWKKAQDLLKRRTRDLNMNSNMSVFAGFIKCGDCGRSLVRKNNNYCCGTYVRSGRQYCTPHSMPHPVLEKIILDDLNTIIQNVITENAEDFRETVRKSCAEAGTVKSAAKSAADNEIIKVNTELEKVKKLKKAIYEDYREELISKEEYVTYKQDYLKKEEQLKKQLNSLEERSNLEADRNIFEIPWVKRLLEQHSAENLDRDIVVEMLYEIKVYEDRKIEITYNFSDELETLFKSRVSV